MSTSVEMYNVVLVYSLLINIGTITWHDAFHRGCNVFTCRMIGTCGQLPIALTNRMFNYRSWTKVDQCSCGLFISNVMIVFHHASFDVCYLLFNSVVIKRLETCIFGWIQGRLFIDEKANNVSYWYFFHSRPGATFN